MRLIDADALAVIDGKALFMGRNAGKMRAMTIDLVKQLVATAPTIDTVEVRHGEWKDKDWSGISVNGHMACSECNVMIPNCDDKTRYCLARLYYCPNCGAKMDEKGEG